MSMGIEKDPHGFAQGVPGAKLDAGKAPVMRGVIQYFPRALRAIAEVSEIGAEKYSWKGWEQVPDGVNRYSDALGRHLLDDAIAPYDTATGKLHKAHIAWNALAILEMILREEENVGQTH